MEKNRKLQIYSLFAASLLLGVFGAVCLFLGILSEYNDAMGHFNVGSLFAPVAYASIVAGPVLGIVGWVLFSKRSVADKALPSGKLTVVASLAAAVGIIVSALAEIIEKTGAPVRTIGGADILSWILAAGAAASFVCSAFFAKSGPVKPWISLLSFVPVFYCASRVLLLYFDQTVAVNSPVKLICQLTYLAPMLVLTAETGISLGKGEIFPRYIFTLCCGTCIAGIGAVSALLVMVTGASCAAVSNLSVAAKLGLFIYVCARFAMVSKAEIFETPKKTGKKATEKESFGDEESEAFFEE